MQKAINKILVIICGFSIFGQQLFFSFMGLVGIEYEGSESSKAYVYYMVAIAGLMLAGYLYGVVAKGVLKLEAIIVAIVVGFFILHVLWVLFDPVGTNILPEFLMYFLLFGLPGILAASTIIKLGLMPQLIRLGEVFSVMIALGVIMYAVLPSFAGIKTSSLAGASYQVLSYYSAFAFGLLLIYSFYLPKSLRFVWTSMLLYRFFSLGLLIGCIVACFIGGGRGAFLLLLGYLVMTCASVVFNKKSYLTQKGFIDTCIKIFFIMTSVTLFFVYFWERDFIQAGFSRATQFISGSGKIDLERGSSGRDLFYKVAIDYIAERPLLGYGPFGFRDKTIHAHNFFLEVLLQFGLIGLLLFCIAMCVLALNAIRNWTVYSYWVFGLLLYPLVMIMFSSAYLHSALFCFGMSFFMIYKKNHYDLALSAK